MQKAAALGLAWMHIPQQIGQCQDTTDPWLLLIEDAASSQGRCQESLSPNQSGIGQ